MTEWIALHDAYLADTAYVAFCFAVARWAA